MGNVLWRAEDPEEEYDYHKLASKNLASLIEAEDGRDEDDDMTQNDLTTSLQTQTLETGDAGCETPRGRWKSNWCETPHLGNGKTVRFPSEIAQRQTSRAGEIQSQGSEWKTTEVAEDEVDGCLKLEDEVDGCFKWEDEVDGCLKPDFNDVESLKQGEDDGTIEGTKITLDAEMVSPVNGMTSPASSRLETLRYNMVQIDTDGKVNYTSDSSATPSPIQGSPISELIHPGDYDLPFENLVFEGGGNKGLAHCGALRYLEKIGIKDEKIKRVAGASAGSIFAALVSVGYTADEIEKEMRENNMKRMFLDGSWLGIMRNLIWHFGMHEANAIYNWLGAKLAEKAKHVMPKKSKLQVWSKKCKHQDITFEQVYTYFGKELCVVVTNLNRMTTEYCHPKTTPRMPVREAVRMSTSLPGLFTAKQYELHGDTDVFVDGGVLCNYPIHCFDGWYLSMAPGDSLTEKLLEVENLHELNQSRFESEYLSTNYRTLGISIFAEHEEDLLKHDLEKQHGRPHPVKPKNETPLYIKWKEKNKARRKSSQFRLRREEAVKAFLDVLQQCPKDENNEINRVEIEKAIEEDQFLQERKKEIFGVDPCLVFNTLNPEKTGKIHYGKLIGELSDLDIQIQNRSLGCQRTIIDGFYSFLDRIQSTLLVNVKKSYVKITDAERTVGINTGHVETNSFDLEDEDKEFLIQRGENACRRHIVRFIERKDIRLKADQRPSRRSSTDSEMSVD